MADALDTLGALTGLNRATMEELAAQVKANNAKLNACRWHDFAPIPPMQPLRQRYRCEHCGGEIDAHAYYWHQQGRRVVVP